MTTLSCCRSENRTHSSLRMKQLPYRLALRHYSRYSLYSLYSKNVHICEYRLRRYDSNVRSSAYETDENDHFSTPQVSIKGFEPLPIRFLKPLPLPIGLHGVGPGGRSLNDSSLPFTGGRALTLTGEAHAGFAPAYTVLQTVISLLDQWAMCPYQVWTSFSLEKPCCSVVGFDTYKAISVI